MKYTVLLQAEEPDGPIPDKEIWTVDETRYWALRNLLVMWSKQDHHHYTMDVITDRKLHMPSVRQALEKTLKDLAKDPDTKICLVDNGPVNRADRLKEKPLTMQEIARLRRKSKEKLKGKKPNKGGF